MAGLTASAGFAGWVEFLLLRRGMNQKIGRSEFPTSFFMRLWLAAVLAAAVAWGIKLALHPQQPQIAALLILVPYGAVYLGCTTLFGVEQAGALVKRVLFKVPSVAFVQSRAKRGINIADDDFGVSSLAVAKLSDMER